MTEPTIDMNRLEELLADDTLGELDVAEANDFATLAQRFPGINAQSFDDAASLLQIALMESKSIVEPMPANARAKAESAMREAARRVPSASNASRARSHAAEPKLAIADTPAATDRPTYTRPTRPTWFGWVAAAACLLIAAAAWITRPAAPTSNAPPVAIAPTDEDRLEALINAAPDDLVRIAWTVAGDDLTTADYRAGEVVWSDARNEGYMVFEGLAANNPTEEQYQLWVFDATRNDAHPVDGGVFNIASADGRVVVPIDPRIPVREAALFAITVEQPGGVVVSSRERLPLVAPVEGG